MKWAKPSWDKLKTEREASWDKRILAIAKGALREEKGKLTSDVVVFNRAIGKSGMKYTTPLIDLNMAYVVCRELGRRLLSPQYQWIES
jgi:hypothetical protein